MTDAILAKMPGHKLDRFVFSFAPRSSPSLRRLLIYGVAARQCAKNRLPPVAAGRIQRNRAGVSWRTTLLAKSSVLYLCEGEGGTDRLRAPISAVKIVEQKLADGANCTRLPAFCPLRSKGIQAPPQWPSYFFERFPLWLAPPLSRLDFLQISTSQCFSLSVSLL